MHDLRLERFVDEPGDGPMKTFTLRGIKDSPPYLHDGRLLTLEDTVGPRRVSPTALVDAEHAVRRQALDARLTAERHVASQLVAQDIERVVHAFGAADGETPERQASDGHRARAPGDPLEHGGAAAEAAVDDDVGAVADGGRDGGQRVGRGLRGVGLAAA